MRQVRLPQGANGHKIVPPEVVHAVARNLVDVRDVANLSAVNRSTRDEVTNDNALWVGYLKTIGNWKEPKMSAKQAERGRKPSITGHQSLLVMDDELTPVNCLSTPISDPHLARDRFIKVYATMNPVVTDLLVKSYGNFQNLNMFREYDTPSLQAKLFTNAAQFLNLYKVMRPGEYKKMVIRLDTILDLFVSSVMREIGIQLGRKKYEMARTLVSALGDLKIENSEISVDPLNSLFEFFLNRYSESFSAVTDDAVVDEIFVPTDKQKTGVVNGYRLDFDRIDKLFADIEEVLNSELKEVAAIFGSGGAGLKAGLVIDEVPILLKIIETFLSSYLISGLVDKIAARAKDIDESGTERVSLEKVEMKNLLELEKEQRADSQVTSLASAEEPPIASAAANSDDPVGVDDLSKKVEDMQVAEKPETEAEAETEPNSESKPEVPSHITIMNANSLFFQSIPYIHFKLISMLQELKFPDTTAATGGNGKTVKMDYVGVSCGFVNFYYEPYLLEYSEQLPKQCHDALEYMVKAWESAKVEDQQKMENNILSMVEDSSEKKKAFDIFSSFTSIFNFSGTKSSGSADEATPRKENESERKISKMAANLQILMTNVESIKSLVSVDLTVLILQHVKNTYDLLLGLTKYSTTDELNKQLYETCSDVYIDMLSILVDKHIKTGFNEALNTLRNYNPTEFEGEGQVKATSVAVAPLINFIELVNVGDLILQMVNVFYQRELVSNGIVKSRAGKFKDFLSMTQCEKHITKFESILDTFVADGLDISIGVILNEINYTILQSNVNEETYTKGFTGGPSEWIRSVVSILDTHFELLQKTIDKGIMDVFKQEIGERFVAQFIKIVNKRIIVSVDGAMQFVNDVNYLYNFFQKYRVKQTVAYFVAFKQISQLYLVDCSEDKKQCKELGRLVIDIGRDNGVFSPEEVYQFVTRRSDWLHIKRSVDKIMYGFSPDDCVIV